MADAFALEQQAQRVEQIGLIVGDQDVRLNVAGKHGRPYVKSHATGRPGHPDPRGMPIFPQRLGRSARGRG